EMYLYNGTAAAEIYHCSGRHEAQNQSKLEFWGFSPYYAKARSLRALVDILKG
ncbi:hypothetical protein HAX54_031327, partial [Datura stramonium]|nr:hypothetical protein [Datura stramonium]